jgi:hypothetical protein
VALVLLFFFHQINPFFDSAPNPSVNAEMGIESVASPRRQSFRSGRPT